MRFTELEIGQHLQQAVAAMGYEETTPIQAAAIPPGLQKSDILGCAQTGTGKTLAFLLPAMEHVLRNPSKDRHPQVLILEPTRELVIQVTKEARKLADHSALRVASVYGGTNMKRETDRLRRGVDIIVATPGRLQDHMRRRNVTLRHLQILVLDEADRMLDMGFLPDIKQIISRTPPERQTMLFSATIQPTISALARQFQRDPVAIEMDLAHPPEAIEQRLYPVPRHLKGNLLVAILEDIDVTSMLIFTATKVEADIVTRLLVQNGIAVACIHGDFKQRDRESALEGFRSGKHQALVATNIAARGLDVEGISHVVNYDVPEHPEDYIHRIGRTARADATGDAITFVTPDDEPLIHRIEYLLGRKIDRRTLPDFNYDVPTPSWARPSAKALLREATKSQSVTNRWRSMF